MSRMCAMRNVENLIDKVRLDRYGPGPRHRVTYREEEPEEEPQRRVSDAGII